MDLATLVVRLEAQTAEYDKRLAQATNTLQTFKRNNDKTLVDIDKRFQNFGAGIKRTLGFLAGGALLRSVVQATAEAQAVQAQLENAVEATGRVAGFTAPQLSKMANALSDLTTYDDEAIMGMQTLLLSFTRIRGEILERAQPAILDLATRMGTDLKSAALTVGKALENPIEGLTALQKAGVRLTDAQKDTIKQMVEVGNVAGAQGIVLKELERRFGGAAEAAANTFGGALKQLQNAFDDLLEQNGGLPEATEALRGLTGVLKDPGVKAGVDAFFSTLITGLSKSIELIAKTAAGLKLLGTGRGGNDVVDIDDQIRDLEQRIARIQSGAVRGMPAEARTAEIARLTAEIERLTQRQQMAIDGAVDFDGNIKEVEVSVKRLAVPVHDLGDAVAAVGAEFGSLEQSAKTALNNIVSSFDRLEDIRFDQFGDSLTKALDTAADDISKNVDEAIEKSNKGLSVFAEEAARSTQGIIADTLKNGFKDGAEGVLQSVGDMIVDITAQIVAADLARKLFGDVGKTGDFSGGWVGTAISAIGGLFGGTRDSGGRGQPGMAYAIGTGAQPEMFIPDRPGKFVPANQWGKGGKQLTVHNTFVLEQPASRATQLQVASAASRGLALAQRRNG